MNKCNDEDVVYCKVKDENTYQKFTQNREPASYDSLKTSNFDRCKSRSKDRKWKILASIGLISSFLLICTTIGLCILLVKCEHKNGFSGYMCGISPCQSSPCKNGGTCTTKDHGFSCLCSSGTYGDFCENTSCSLISFNKNDYSGNSCQIKPCLDGWLFNDTFFACYFIGHTNKSWSDANDTCASMDSCLSTIWSLDEARWIGDLTEGDTWIGGRQVGEQYRWYCGSSNYENVINQDLWAQGEPNLNGQCVQLWKYTRYMLDDDACETLQKFVCKRTPGRY